MFTLLKIPPHHSRRLSLHSPYITTPTSSPSPPAADPTAIVSLILTSTNPQTLTQTLHSPTLPWTPQLVDQIIKRLWNHAYKALHFFTVLSYHPTYSHSLSSFDHAVDLAARLRDYKTVWTLVHRMKSLRLGPTPKTFAIIAERYASAGKADRAVKLFLSMHEHGCGQSLTSFNTILDVLCKEKKVEKAYSLFKIFRGKFKADVVSYNVIANGWCLVKRTGKALEILTEMVDRGLEPNLTTYNIMLKGYFRAGQIEEGWSAMFVRKKSDDLLVAGKLLIEMVDRGFMPRKFTLNRILNGLLLTDDGLLLFPMDASCIIHHRLNEEFNGHWTWDSILEDSYLYQSLTENRVPVSVWRQSNIGSINGMAVISFEIFVDLGISIIEDIRTDCSASDVVGDAPVMVYSQIPVVVLVGMYLSFGEQ
ncbi:hypothetical protein Pint_15364 [Pistacia integerrima]|uniref:Uncharacterized protein n=1 Tax=Pistacia integerrima TaxID=434235 RepID=A0ACC0ZC27_9ROSI|nr:hypothetical protein Pint_15364 [Pistacia integerrima]